jgi:divalent metal cation (Fe/Co/Zn/Cd) transporter
MVRRTLDLRRSTPDPGDDQSIRTVLVALGANLGVTVAKSVASVLSGSASPRTAGL